jgi:hypothetical protein
MASRILWSILALSLTLLLAAACTHDEAHDTCFDDDAGCYGPLCHERSGQKWFKKLLRKVAKVTRKVHKQLQGQAIHAGSIDLNDLDAHVSDKLLDYSDRLRSALTKAQRRNSKAASATDQKGKIRKLADKTYQLFSIFGQGQQVYDTVDSSTTLTEALSKLQRFHEEFEKQAQRQSRGTCSGAKGWFKGVPPTRDSAGPENGASMSQQDKWEQEALLEAITASRGERDTRGERDGWGLHKPQAAMETMEAEAAAPTKAAAGLWGNRPGSRSDGLKNRWSGIGGLDADADGFKPALRDSASEGCPTQTTIDDLPSASAKTACQTSGCHYSTDTSDPFSTKRICSKELTTASGETEPLKLMGRVIQLMSSKLQLLEEQSTQCRRDLDSQILGLSELQQLHQKQHTLHAAQKAHSEALKKALVSLEQTGGSAIASLEREVNGLMRKNQLRDTATACLSTVSNVWCPATHRCRDIESLALDTPEKCPGTGWTFAQGAAKPASSDLSDKDTQPSDKDNGDQTEDELYMLMAVLLILFALTYKMIQVPSTSDSNAPQPAARDHVNSLDVVNAVPMPQAAVIANTVATGTADSSPDKDTTESLQPAVSNTEDEQRSLLRTIRSGSSVQQLQLMGFGPVDAIENALIAADGDLSLAAVALVEGVKKQTTIGHSQRVDQAGVAGDDLSSVQAAVDRKEAARNRLAERAAKAREEAEPKTVWDEQWGSILVELQEMGFEDRATNKRVVSGTNGNLKSAVQKLVQEEREKANFTVCK